jgi:hypothetical protein
MHVLACGVDRASFSLLRLRSAVAVPTILSQIFHANVFKLLNVMVFIKDLYTKVILKNYINLFFKINSKYLINYTIIEYNNRVPSRTEPVLVNCSRLRLRGVPALQELRL